MALRCGIVFWAIIRDLAELAFPPLHFFDKTEAEKRRYNIVIRGVDEQTHPNPRTAVDLLFQTMQAPITSAECDGIYRMGPAFPKPKIPRPIMVELSKKMLKGSIYNSVKNLKGNREWSTVSISDDLSPEENNKLRDFKTIAAQAKSLGIAAKVQNRAIVIDNVRYSHSELDSLPRNLSLANTKTVSLPTGIAFQSHHSYLSNMYMSHVSYRTHSFRSAEHAFAHTAAVTCGESDLAQLILATPDPYEAKRIAKPLKSKQAWANCKREILEEILLAKFQQNESIRRKLLSTGDAPLFEATTDLDFGCGFTLSERNKIGPTVPGKNICGKLLVKIREALK